MANKLTEIKNLLDIRRGETILLQTNIGRQRIIEKTGILAETYPSIFIVKLTEAGGREKSVSYSYADILTETVKVVFEGEVLA